MTLFYAMRSNFLGNSAQWYKLTIIFFLLINPILLYTAGPFITGWLLIGEFIFTLAMALKCYPLPAGGLLAIEAVALGMTSPASVYQEANFNFAVILLLIFMVAGIYFMKDFLQFTFTKFLIMVKSKILISLLFCLAGAFLSAFLDALTVVAVIIAVAYGFYDVYHRFASERMGGTCDICCDEDFSEKVRMELQQFRGYLRNLMMHGAVGTALGGVCTLVGEPQNLLIANVMGWSFGYFFVHVAPVSMPVLLAGLLTCIFVEKFRLFSYGFEIPENIRNYIVETAIRMEKNRDAKGRAKLLVQGISGIWLVLALAFHLAEVGIIGLSVIILLTSFCGITEEHRIGRAFEEALPFTALLVVFFAIVAVIHDQHLFKPVIDYVLSLQGKTQLAAYYIANGLLSMISDNVFVATVYISETKMHFVQLLDSLPDIQMTGEQLMTALTDKNVPRADVLARLPQSAADQAAQIMSHFDRLAVSINTGTNIPSVATPNGQAAFLFVLTSALAPAIRLSYGRMIWLALPYTIIMTFTGLAATWFLL